MDNLQLEFGNYQEKSKERELDEKLSHILIFAGIPPHIKGFQFLRDAIRRSVLNPDLINHVTRQLYPQIAEHFNTTPSKVERAIRHSIEVASNRGKIENLNSLYKIKIFNKNDKPTNSELIALIADKMIIEYNF